MGNPATQNIVAGLPVVTGGVSTAVLGTALPTDEATALNAAFKGLGFVGDAGLVINPTKTTTEVRDWRGRVVKKLQTETSETAEFTLIESLNPDVASSVFGSANVVVTAATATTGTKLSIKHNDTVLANAEWVFDMFDGNAKRRIVVPNGQLTLNGAINYTRSDVTSYPVLIEMFPDSSGNYAYEYTDDGVHV